MAASTRDLAPLGPRLVRYSPKVAAGLGTAMGLVAADLMAYEESDRQGDDYANALLAVAWLGEEVARRARAKRRHRRVL